jgi:site-specific DNA recombinase
MIRGVTYNRFSSDNQRTESIDAQIRFNHDYAKKQGIEIIKDYKDEAVSGKTDDRPQFQQMLSDAKAGLFNVVICHKVDRFARNRIESAINKYNLRKCNVKVLFSGQSIDDTPEGQLMEGILESMAEYYSLNLAKETMKGLKENAYKCKFNGGIVPFGYSVDPITKTYIVNEKEASYVKLIFKMYIDGSTYPNIINKLNEYGVKTRLNKEFTYASLHDMLINEKYIGIYSFNKRKPRTLDGKRNNRSLKDETEVIRIPNGVPQIIDTDVFLEVQKQLDFKKRATRKATEAYL